MYLYLSILRSRSFIFLHYIIIFNIFNRASMQALFWVSFNYWPSRHLEPAPKATSLSATMPVGIFFLSACVFR